jgi:hypothetical protein
VVAFHEPEGVRHRVVTGDRLTGVSAAWSLVMGLCTRNSNRLFQPQDPQHTSSVDHPSNEDFRHSSSSHSSQKDGPIPTATGALGIKVHQTENFALAPPFLYFFYQDVPMIASVEPRNDSGIVASVARRGLGFG